MAGKRDKGYRSDRTLGAVLVPENLTAIADRLIAWNDETKGRSYYELYDRYFAPLAERTVTVLELGVYRGESTRVLATYFTGGTVIAVDVEDRGLDFSRYPNVIFERADQRDEKRLLDICARRAPKGIDIVIDDAAHIGEWSQRAYRTLLPVLKPGGLYIVEDWGTGYWDDWPDGGALREARRPILGRKRRLPSHDYGMVGFLKGVFEDVATDVAPTRFAPRTRSPQLEFMHLYAPCAILKKLER